MELCDWCGKELGKNYEICEGIIETVFVKSKMVKKSRTVTEKVCRNCIDQHQD